MIDEEGEAIEVKAAANLRVALVAASIDAVQGLCQDMGIGHGGLHWNELREAFHRKFEELGEA